MGRFSWGYCLSIELRVGHLIVFSATFGKYKRALHAVEGALLSQALAPGFYRARTLGIRMDF